MKLKKIAFAVVGIVLTLHAQAITMQNLFDEVGASGNVSNPAALQGQTMNMYMGGSMFMRMPNRTYNIVAASAPSWSAGCGGIDLFAGGFSFINKEQFVAMLRNIGSNALGYGFKLALQNLCPTCDNVMQALQATANAVNRLNIDSCEAAKGIVNAAKPDSWTKGVQNAAKNFGVDGNIFTDITDAWTKVMNNQPRANEAIEQTVANKPETADDLPTGNIVWKALKKIDGIDDEYRMILMSMIGTTIFNTTTPTKPVMLTRKDITVEQLVGKQDTSLVMELPIWRCDDTAADKCLNPYSDKSSANTKSFRYMVRTQMWKITDKIAARQAHGDVDAILAFLNVTDIPVYKMLAVSTTLGNTGMADVLVSRYQDLIAAKYAEVFIRRAVTDLYSAMAAYQAQAGDAAVSNELKEYIGEMDKIREQARQVLATAYSQTTSTFAIAQEVQHIERAMNANMSQTLRASLNFAKSIR